MLIIFYGIEQGKRLVALVLQNSLQDQADHGKNINFIIGGALMEHQTMLFKASRT
jgi:23S rRNA pseudoU1915 N3-methylase RlmH